MLAPWPSRATCAQLLLRQEDNTRHTQEAYGLPLRLAVLFRVIRALVVVVHRTPTTFGLARIIVGGEALLAIVPHSKPCMHRRWMCSLEARKGLLHGTHGRRYPVRRARNLQVGAHMFGQGNRAAAPARRTLSQLGVVA